MQLSPELGKDYRSQAVPADPKPTGTGNRASTEPRVTSNLLPTPDRPVSQDPCPPHHATAVLRTSCMLVRTSSTLR